MDPDFTGLLDGFAENIDVVFGVSGAFQRHPALPDNRFNAGDGHAGQADDEIGLAFRREHQGDGAAFAVADDAYLVEALPEQFDAGKGIVLEVDGGGFHHVSRRTTDAPVIIAERSDTRPRERIGNDRKGPVFKDFLVPVLLPAAGDHDQDGRLARVTFRQHEGSGQFCFAVGEGDFLLGVREGTYGVLRSVQFLFGGQGQRQGQAPLLERSQDLFARPETFIGGTQTGDLDGNASDSRPFNLDGYSQCRLVRRIHGRLVSIQMEHDGKRGAPDIQFSRPVSRLGVREEHGGEQQNDGSKDLFHGRMIWCWSKDSNYLLKNNNSCHNFNKFHKRGVI